MTTQPIVLEQPCPFCGFECELVESADGEAAYVQCVGVKFHRMLWLDGDNNAANDVREAFAQRSSNSEPRRPA